MDKILLLPFLAAMMFCQQVIAAETADDVLSNSISHSPLGTMPAEWFTCQTSNDCTWIGYDCGGDGYAVNISHVKNANEIFCVTYHLCRFTCAQSAIPNSKAVCEAGRCVTEPITPQ